MAGIALISTPGWPGRPSLDPWPRDRGIELLGGTVCAWRLPFFQCGQALDNDKVEVFEPFGRNWHSILLAESNPDWLDLWPGQENGP